MSKKNVFLATTNLKPAFHCPFLDRECIQTECGCFNQNCNTCAVLLTANNIFILNCNLEKLIKLNS
jgi:hypothetical protein